MLLAVTPGPTGIFGVDPSRPPPLLLPPPQAARVSTALTATATTTCCRVLTRSFMPPWSSAIPDVDEHLHLLLRPQRRETFVHHLIHADVFDPSVGYVVPARHQVQYGGEILRGVGQ